ncbi:hypothetical protein [Streptomyces chiangmaiensis]|uniref:UDP-N-acetylmuramyl pentapeptide phosphotransferase/UDP-N-acetylglucosamine-1-phosphate transferase n=1 Tax=Streptomyces chiangmaiensis TaxID=766497 RepID=A0ABU7FIL1_9ACTN|nr:hypothetical protein [Streptomyces chiangmaiensis]MED7823961.1 hypothetical protein [Streptomyces chiangmaiensis]
MISRTRRTTSFGLAAAVARVATDALRTTAPGGHGRWERANHAGRTVGLYAGPAVAAATALAAGRTRPAVGAAVLAAGVCGAYDDIAGAGDPRRGFRAHLSALRAGDVSSGAVKLFGISTAALAAGAVLEERPLDKVLAGVVIAGTAHLVNLVDVRPGRAAGAVVALGALGLLRDGAAGELSAAAAGAAAAVLPDDLGERVMIGDTGAHALGAALGAAAVAGWASSRVWGSPRGGRAGLLAHAAVLVAAAAYGEKVSAAARSWGTR